MELTKIEEPVAVGTFEVVIPANYKEVVAELADPKPPSEGYFRDDKEDIRQQCAVSIYILKLINFLMEFI